MTRTRWSNSTRAGGAASGITPETTSEALSEAPREIRTLTGLRGPASVVVVAWHMHPTLVAAVPMLVGWVDVVANMAASAVDLFFILSGFVMTYVYADALGRPTRSSVAAFWIRRVARLWPLHVATTAAMWLGHLALRGQDGGSAHLFTGSNLAANVAMLHEFGPFEAINLPAWSVAPEMGAYLAFPVIAATLLRVRRGWILGLGAVPVLLLGSMSIDLLYAGTEPGTWSHTIAWARLGVGFLAGCLVARAWMDLPPRLRFGRGWDLLAVIGIVGAVLVTLGPRGVELGVPAWPFPVLALVVLGAAGAAGPVRAALSGRAANYLGRISYALYLTHFPAIVFLSPLLMGAGLPGLPLPFRLLLVAGLAVVLLLIAGIAHHFLEEPARRWFRRRWGTPSPRVGDVASGAREGNVAP